MKRGFSSVLTLSLFQRYEDLQRLLSVICPQRIACAIVSQNPDKVIKGNYTSLLFVKLSARVYYLMFMMKYKTAKKIDMREREYPVNGRLGSRSLSRIKYSYWHGVLLLEFTINRGTLRNVNAASRSEFSEEMIEWWKYFLCKQDLMHLTISNT